MALGPGVLNGRPPPVSKGQPSGLPQKALTRSSRLYHWADYPIFERDKAT